MTTQELRDLTLNANNSNTKEITNGNYTHEYKFSRIQVIKQLDNKYENKQGNLSFLLAQKVEKTSHLKVEGSSGGNDILGLANKSEGVDKTYTKSGLRTFIYLVAPEKVEQLKTALANGKELFLPQEVSNTPIFTEEEFKKWSYNNTDSIDDYRKIKAEAQIVKNTRGEVIVNDDGHNMYRRNTMKLNFQEDVYTKSSVPFMLNQEQEEFALDMNQDGSGQNI